MHRPTALSAVLRHSAFACLLAASLMGCATTHMAFKPSALGVTRTDSELDNRWRFVRKDVPGAQEIGFDDAKWQPVSLPHTWNGKDGQDGGGNYYRGPGWYRKHLNLLTTDFDRSIYLRFEGAATVTDVYVNGRLLGSHRGAFGAFCFDVTGLLHPGDNVLAVRVDNSKFDDVPPLSGDFNIGGGLYRPVHLITVDPLHVTLLDDSSPGVYLQTDRVNSDAAEVTVTTKVRNATRQQRSTIVAVTIKNARDEEVAGTQEIRAIPGGATIPVSMKVIVPQPRLWDGANDPYLYSATIEIRNQDTITDRITQPLGIRTYEFDANKGFFLNGKPYALHGVNRHEDWKDKGRALSKENHDADFAMLKEIGATVVRCCHYQHSDYFYSLCDKGGIAVWAELAMVNQLKNTAQFDANAEQQLRELIKQNYNHPSIIVWSLFNELGLRSKVPDWSLVERLNKLAHELDPGRPTTDAMVLKVEHPLTQVADVTGFNRYWGWYSGTVEDWGPELDKLHAAAPSKPLAITEYGAGASVKQHEVNPTTRPNTKGEWHPENWQAIVHEGAYGAMTRKPWLWGTFVWCMFDFSSDGRSEGDQHGINDKGLVTQDRLVKKDAFYFYKANWTTKPAFSYVADRRANPRPAGTTDVKVYSNCDDVELFVNGKSLGRKQASDVTNHVFLWQGVTLNLGKNKVKADGTMEGVRGHRNHYVDEVTWEGVREMPTSRPMTNQSR